MERERDDKSYVDKEKEGWQVEKDGEGGRARVEREGWKG